MRLGEHRYRLLTNNCEHFCEWCVNGAHRSYQVEELINRCVRLWQKLVRVFLRASFKQLGMHWAKGIV